MSIVNILDEPIGLRLKNGYIFCPNCGNYEHHPLIYCGCGSKFIREKKLTWREFLRITAHPDRCGPMVTFKRLVTGSFLNDRKLTLEEHKVISKAEQVVRQAEEINRQNIKDRIILIRIRF